MVLLSGAASSFFLVRELEKRVANTRALCRLLRICTVQVEYFARSAGDILLNCDVLLLRECGFHGEKTPNTFLEFFCSCEILCEESREIMLEFGNDFGKNYRDEQVRRCKYYTEQIAAQEAALSAALPTQRKLAVALSVSLTLAVVILLV